MNLPRLHFAQIDEQQLTHLAQSLAPPTRASGGVLYLRGELGVGKTTFVRALLGALDVAARIKSPTYSLIESYAIGELSIHHLDLYRIADPRELEWLGLAELTQGRYLLLVEWPERAQGALPAPDVIIDLAHASAGRELRAKACSLNGQAWLEWLPH